MQKSRARIPLSFIRSCHQHAPIIMDKRAPDPEPEDQPPTKKQRRGSGPTTGTVTPPAAKKTTPSLRAVLFEAGAITYREVSLRKKGGSYLEALQRHVGGNIEILPHKKANEAHWVAYANEDGMGRNLPSNFVAWGVLRHLGFESRYTVVPGAHLGNILLCVNDPEGEDEKSLTDADVARVQKAYAKYVADMEA